MREFPWARPARRLARAMLVLILGYAALAYLVFPVFWRHYEHLPRLENVPKKTYKTERVYGDPLNAALVGGRDEIVAALTAAGWKPAAEKSLGVDLRLIESELLDRPYPTAPVSNLFLYGRKQDLAFEQAAGRSIRSRHHVRFWRSPEIDETGREIWLGAATFDRSLGISRRTGQITHHISPDIDAERDKLFADLEAAGRLTRVFQVTGIGPTLRDVNGEKDWYFTDGEMTVGILTPAGAPAPAAAERRPSPGHVRLTNGLWKALGAMLSPKAEAETKGGERP